MSWSGTSKYTPFLLSSFHLSTKADSPDQLSLESFDVASLWEFREALVNQSGTEKAVHGPFRVQWEQMQCVDHLGCNESKCSVWTIWLLVPAVTACEFHNTTHGPVFELFPPVPKADGTHIVCHPSESDTKDLWAVSSPGVPSPNVRAGEKAQKSHPGAVPEFVNVLRIMQAFCWCFRNWK